MFRFKRDCELYLYNGSQSIRLYTYSDIEVSQTFNETKIRRKNLHEPTKYFDDALIVKANEGNFSFTIPFTKSHYNRNLIDYALNCSSFDLYLVEPGTKLKVTKAVINNCIFQITKGILLLNISGSFSKVEQFVGAVPGIISDIYSLDYFVPFDSEIELNSNLIDFITGINLEIRNDIQWINNNTIHASRQVTNTGNTVYKTDFVVSGKVLSGNIEKAAETTDNIIDWSNTSILIITLRDTSNYEISFQLPSLTYTKRTNFGDILTASIDFRATDSDFTITY